MDVHIKKMAEEIKDSYQSIPGLHEPRSCKFFYGNEWRDGYFIGDIFIGLFYLNRNIIYYNSWFYLVKSKNVIIKDEYYETYRFKPNDSELRERCVAYVVQAYANEEMGLAINGGIVPLANDLYKYITEDIEKSDD